VGEIFFQHNRRRFDITKLNAAQAGILKPGDDSSVRADATGAPQRHR
jgi:hypothetical protein